MIHRLGWQQLETRRHNFHLCFLFKIIHNLTCVPFSDTISSKSTTTAESTITRRPHVNNILVPFARTLISTCSDLMLVISGITYLITSKKLPLLNNLRIKLINCNCINVPSLCKVFTCEVDTVIINKSLLLANFMVSFQDASQK